MRYYPWSIQNALDNRGMFGEAAVTKYWTEYMNIQQRNAVDVWIMENRPDVLARCAQGTQSWRFKTLIEVLYAEHEKEKKERTVEAARGPRVHEVRTHDT